jgi:hypothetical protein
MFDSFKSPWRVIYKHRLQSLYGHANQAVGYVFIEQQEIWPICCFQQERKFTFPIRIQLYVNGDSPFRPCPCAAQSRSVECPEPNQIERRT